MKKRIITGLAVFAVLYCAAYITLRSQHVIMHFSNAKHWYPEKRSPDHFVDTSSEKTVYNRVIKVIFFPAMLAEQTARDIAG
jgi:hypothetical protein